MKFTVVAICLVAFLMVADAAPQFFDFKGIQGTIDSSHTVNGVESSNVDPKLISKAEEVIKAMIHKQLAKKKQNKKVARKEKAAPAAIVEEPKSVEPKAPQEALPSSIPWDENPEARDRINKQVPGGTASVDALIQLLREKQN